MLNSFDTCTHLHSRPLCCTLLRECDNNCSTKKRQGGRGGNDLVMAVTVVKPLCYCKLSLELQSNFRDLFQGISPVVGVGPAPGAVAEASHGRGRSRRTGSVICAAFINPHHERSNNAPASKRRAHAKSACLPRSSVLPYNYYVEWQLSRIRETCLSLSNNVKKNMEEFSKKKNLLEAH